MANDLQFIGHLAMRYGISMLYASQQDYANDVAVNAIAIHGDRQALEQLVRQFSYQDVVLEGVFRRKEQNMAWSSRLTPPFKASRPITLSGRPSRMYGCTWNLPSNRAP